jgi:ribosomal-protein-serine acetyltransferase
MRVPEESDADELHALIEANRVHLAPWMQWAEHQTHEQTRAFIQATHRQIADHDGLQMVLIADTRIVGVLGYHAIDWHNRSTSIGYWLDLAHQGQGIMSPAVSALVAHGLREWRLNRVEIRAAVENVRSRALIERLGFQYEGTARQSFRIGEGYRDDAVYSLLASDPNGPS